MKIVANGNKLSDKVDTIIATGSICDGNKIRIKRSVLCVLLIVSKKGFKGTLF